MAEWLIDEGITARRAMLIEHGATVEALVEDPEEPLPLGLVADARVGPPAPGGGRTRVLIGTNEALLRGAPGAPEGATIRVQVVRERIPEPGNPKPAQLVLAASGTPCGPPASLLIRLAKNGAQVMRVPTHGPDPLEEAGWSELIEAARTGLFSFDGGLLRIVPTPAMTVIDVDGIIPPAPLALAGAAAAARAIRLFGIGGSIGIDLPSVPDRGVRQAAAATIDRLLPRPFERTAVNGFGFLQIVRPRPRASLIEQVQADPIGVAARALVERAARAQPPGALTLVGAPPVAKQIEQRPAWLARLATRRGGPICLRADASLTISGGYVETPHRP